MRLFFLIGRSQNLIEGKIKELSSNFLTLSYQNNFKDFILELQKNLNQRIFGENKDIVLKNLFQLKEKEIEVLFNLIQENKKIKFIFVFEAEPENFFNYLREKKIRFQVVYLNVPKGKELEKFIADYLEKVDLKLSKDFINLLKENYQENLEELLQDLERLKFFKNIPEAQLKNLFHFQTNSFKVHDYFFEKNWPYFVHSFKKFIFKDKSREKIETLKILSFLLHSLIKIYLLKKDKRVKIAGHFYYLQKLQAKSEKLKLEEIKLLVSALAKTDKKFKKFMIQIKDLPEDVALNYLLSQQTRIP